MGRIRNQVSFACFLAKNTYLTNTSLQNGGFQRPRDGKKNDKAHPPIHPTAHAANLQPDAKRVYEYVTRRFLACCSKDAEGFQTTVDVVVNDEEFYATGMLLMFAVYSGYSNQGLVYRTYSFRKKLLRSI